MKRIDVAVIGGGPSGLSAAWSTARHGIDVALFEEHEEIGKPRHCAGLVSGEGLKLIGMPCRSSFIENKIYRALVIFSDFCIELKKVGDPLYVLDRELFDKEMAERALRAGANILLSAHVKELKSVPEGIIIKTTRGDYLCRLIIDGEGSRAYFARKMGLSGPRFKLPALQMDLRGANVHDDEVLIIKGKEWAPDFFAWVIPLGDSEVRVGVASTMSCCSLLLGKLIKHHPIVSKLLRDCTIKRTYGGTIVVGSAERTYSDSFITVGDAAGQTKPLTGGGIVYGSLCGSIAGVVAAKVVRREVEERVYETMWRRLLGVEESLGLLVREFTKESIDRVVRLASRAKLISLFEESVHYDYHITSILKRPALLLVSILFLTLLEPVKAFKYSVRTLFS